MPKHPPNLPELPQSLKRLLCLLSGLRELLTKLLKELVGSCWPMTCEHLEQ